MPTPESKQARRQEQHSPEQGEQGIAASQRHPSCDALGARPAWVASTTPRSAAATGVVATAFDLLAAGPAVALALAAGLALFLALAVASIGSLWPAATVARPAGNVCAVFPHGLRVGLFALLFFTSANGLALLVLRQRPAMALPLAIHLGLVMALFLTLPYGKSAHRTFAARPG